MELLESHLDTSSDEFKANAAHHRALAAAHKAHLETVRLGGGKAQMTRHKARGKLFVRERVEALLDPGTAFLELSPLAAHELYEGEAPCAGLVTGVGSVRGRHVMVVANDATVKGGTYFPMTVKKHVRAQEIALENRLPCVYHGSSKRPRRSDSDFNWSGRVAAGRMIEIKGVNGGIVAEASTGSEVEVVARKSGRRNDPAEVSIEVIEHAGGVTLCAVYPTPRGGRANVCAPGGEGRMSTKDNDVQVEFTVRVPAGVRFVGRTVNGSIEARGLKADVEAHTVNGSIELVTGGVALATTVNGSIEAEMGAAASSALEFETVNGGITLTIPAGSGAEMSASTVNGDISTDFPLTVRGRFNGRRLSGTIGGGGPRLTMTTVNGDIRLRSAS